jgi:hypothetical protein
MVAALKFKSLNQNSLQSERGDLFEREFRTVGLLLENYIIKHEFRVHSGAFLEFRLETIGMSKEEKEQYHNTPKQFAKIKPESQVIRCITGRTIRRAPDNNRTIIELEKSTEGFISGQSSKSFENMEINIYSYDGDEPVVTKEFPNGFYQGQILNREYSGDDGLYFDCIIPSAHMDRLLPQIRLKPEVSLYINIDVLSFGTGNHGTIYTENGNVALISSIHTRKQVTLNKPGFINKWLRMLVDEFK